MAELVITEQNFDEEVMRAKEPVLIDFWATWCGPCRMLAPVIEEIAKEYEGKVKVGKVNVDDERELALQFGVNSIPTVMVFQNGEIKATSVGYHPRPRRYHHLSFPITQKDHPNGMVLYLQNLVEFRHPQMAK